MRMQILNRLFLLILFIISLAACQQNKPVATSTLQTLQQQSDFIDSLQYRSFLYFMNEINPEKGLVRDRSNPSAPATIAGVGFAMPVWAVGAEHGWISRDEAAILTLNVLRFFAESEQSSKPDATGYKGMYYHFITMDKGKRTWESELSTVDTGLLLAGARFAHNYYNHDTSQEKEIRELADLLTNRVEWDWATIHEDTKFKDALALGWKPETGLDPVGWVGFNEALIMYIVAAGSGYQGAAKAYERWLSFYDWRKPYEDIEYVSFPPLFGHHYSHAFVDFRNLPDSYMREKGLDYFENGKRTVQVHQRYSIQNPRRFTGYDSLTWGLTACDGPGPNYNTKKHKFEYYTARGTSGPTLIQNDDGTIAPTAAASSIIFEPNIVIPTIFNMYQKYGAKGLWGKYGFKDAFNPTADWIASEYLSIDQAPIVLMIENWRNEFVWKYMMQDSVIQKGLRVLGFQKTAEYPFEEAISDFENQDKENAPPKDAVLFVGSSSIVMWKSLKEDFRPLKVINRGFGGSQAYQLIHFFDRVVVPYKPKAIVLYEGDNDVAFGKSPVEVLQHIKEVARLVKTKLPGTPLYVLAIKPSVARTSIWPVAKECNQLIEAFCAKTENVDFIDISKPMIDANGNIRDDIFLNDMLHMNAKGYGYWVEIVKPYLSKFMN